MMTWEQSRDLQRDLQAVFDKHKVNVSTGILTGHKGVAIISRDENVSVRRGNDIVALAMELME